MIEHDGFGTSPARFELIGTCRMTTARGRTNTSMKLPLVYCTSEAAVEHALSSVRLCEATSTAHAT